VSIPDVLHAKPRVVEGIYQNQFFLTIDFLRIQTLLTESAQKLTYFNSDQMTEFLTASN